MYNLSEVTSILINYFTENSIFSLEKDFQKLIKIPSDEVTERAIIKAGLDRLVDEKILVKLPNDVYLLEKSLAKYPQAVEIPFPITLAIADIVNAVCHDLQDEVNTVDPLAINANDIGNLVQIIRNYEKYGSATGKQ